MDDLSLSTCVPPRLLSQPIGHISPVSNFLMEPQTRHNLIAQAAYFRAQRLTAGNVARLTLGDVPLRRPRALPMPQFRFSAPAPAKRHSLLLAQYGIIGCSAHNCAESNQCRIDQFPNHLNYRHFWTRRSMQ
jgi:hypothetical protein